ncbi:MAG TPA: hypothetical protein VMF08_17240 [Candidatus Sulfotelmatobacter sp.]|nr:hypothetical protein [Candidatus Sulfotelmatobacter sp.]
MPEIQSFSIKYEGEALADHTIDVLDLAPALLALPTLIQEANRIANNDGSTLSIRVKPPSVSASAGSFEIGFSVIRDAVEHSVDFFNAPGVSALTNATSLLWWGTATATAGAEATLIAFVRFMEGRKAQKVTRIDDSFVEVETDGDSIKIRAKVWELYQSPTIRAAFYQVVKPLERDGVEKLEFKSPAGQTAEVKQEDAPFYLPPPEHVEPLQEFPPRETFVNVVHMWFRNGNKWRFSEGDNEWSADVKDHRFIESLLKGEETISANDYLKVVVKQTQTRYGSTIHSDYEILKVLEHRKVPKQIPLPDRGQNVRA